MKVADLFVQFAADVAQLRKDVDSAKGIVAGGASAMKSALGAIGVGLSVAGFAAWIKSSIDAADQMKAFSQKTGVAVKDVAGLQLAFKQGGVEGGALTASLARMTREMVSGNDAFKTLGVSTRNADGSLRSTKEVLFDTADALSSVKGDAERGSLAMDIFGKSGAELLPVFADGADGLREMAEMADKLGLSLDGEAAEAADGFNDTLELVGMATQGVGRQVAAHLLPALNGIVGAFLDFITEGDRVKKMANIIASGLKILYAAGVAIVEVFSTVGKTIGASMAAIVKIMQGDFKGAINVGKEWVADMKTDWTKAIANVGDAWEGTSADTTKALASVSRSMRDVKIATDAQKEAQKAAAQQQKEAAKEADRLAKEREKLLKDELDLLAKRGLAAVKAYEDEEAAIDASLAKAREMVEGINAQTAALTMSNTEREISNALLALEKTGLEKGTYAYEQYAQQIREAILNREAVAQSIEQSKLIADNWNALTKEIGQGLTDSLFRAFESGKSFFKTLWDGIVNTFKTTVLRLAINAVMNPINTAIGGALGGGSTLAHAGTGGGLLGGFGGGLGSFGSGLTAGFGSLFGEAGIAGGMSAGMTALGAGNIMGGLGTIVGVAGPIALAAGAIYGLYQQFKHTATPHTGAALTMGADGTVTQRDWRNIETTANAVDALTGITGVVSNILSGLGSVGVGGKFSVGAAYADDKSKDPAWGAFNIRRNGQSVASLGDGDWGHVKFADGEDGFKQFITSIAGTTKAAIGAIGLPQWAQSIVDALGNGATLEQLGSAVDTIIATSNNLKALSSAMDPLGGVFERVSRLSEDARIELAGFAGGMDALIEKSRGYVASFYSEGEQNAITATGIIDTLKAVGITSAGGFDDKADFRSLVDSIDVSTTTGRQQLATLLDVADDFASLTDYMKESGLTLAEIARNVPADVLKLTGGILAGDGKGKDWSPFGDSSTKGGTTPGGSTSGSTTQGSQDGGLFDAGYSADISADLTALGEEVSAAISKMRADMNAALKVIASSTAATARQLQTWDDGGACSTVAA